VYLQGSISSSLTHSLQGFTLECTKSFQHRCYQWEGDASRPRLLLRSDYKNKHFMALQTLTEATVSIGLSRATAICKHSWESASGLRGNTEREGKGSQRWVRSHVPPLLWHPSCFSKSSSEKMINFYVNHSGQ